MLTSNATHESSLFLFIEKAGKNVAELRDATGVKAGVSKVVQGIHDRVLTVTGTLEGVAKVKSKGQRCLVIMILIVFSICVW